MTRIYMKIIKICRVIQLLRRPITVCDHFDVWIGLRYGTMELEVISCSMKI